MASNLLIAHPAWGRTSTLSTTKSLDSDHPVENLIYGGREQFVRDADATANNQGYTFTTGSSSLTPDRLVIGNIDWGLGLDSGATNFQIRLQASNDAFSSLVFDSGFQTFAASNYARGPRSEDAVFIPDNDFPDVVGSFQAATSWRVLHRTASTNSIQLMLSKIYLCEAFDFGRDPQADYETSFQRSSWGRQVGKRLALTWQGVTNAKLEEFRDNHLKYADMCNLFLVEETDAVLAGDKCLFVRIEEFSARPITYNSNQVRIVFQEVV